MNRFNITPEMVQSILEWDAFDDAPFPPVSACDCGADVDFEADNNTLYATWVDKDDPKLKHTKRFVFSEILETESVWAIINMDPDEFLTTLAEKLNTYFSSCDSVIYHNGLPM